MAKDLTNQQKRELAKMLYTKENLTQKEIAERVGASTTSVNKWVKDGQWDSLRTAMMMTNEQQIANLHLQLKEIDLKIKSRPIGERYPTPAEADVISKITSSIQKLEKDLGIEEIVSVSREFLIWVKKVDYQKAQELSGLFDAFIKDKIR